MAGSRKKLTILHSNDLHGDFLAEKVDDKLIGGVSLLSGYVNKTRGEEANTIYCIAGDMFRGSVIDSQFRGISTIEIMNMMAPDVVAIGNHETDYGIAHLLFLEKCAKFPIINSNLHIRTNNARLFRPYHIVEIDGMKILFIGILTADVINQTRGDGVVGSIVDANEACMEIGRICNAYHSVDIDLTVLLTHIGFEEDKKLAEQLDPAWGVDIIIGGHSHTFIDAPAVVNDILIVQAGTGTDRLGRFDISDLAECFPYSDAVHMCFVTGAQLRRMIRYMLRDEALDGGHSEFYQFSRGLAVEYDRMSHSFTRFDFCGAPMEDDRIYRVGLQDYHVKNFEFAFGMPIGEIYGNGMPRIVATACQEILEEYLSVHQNLDHSVCGRLVIR